MVGLPVAVLRPFASAILSDSVCCRKMLVISNLCFICFCPSMDRRSALRSRTLFLAVFAHIAACSRQLSSHYRRLPTALSSPQNSVRVPFGKEEFAVISRYFKSRYHDLAPSALAPRYQTAGSIGALARDEPVTPGVTFLSHPAPNSED